MLRAVLVVGALSAALSVCSEGQADTLPPAQKALRSIHRSVRRVNNDRGLLAYPAQRYLWMAERARCDLDCKQLIAGRWYHRRVTWNHRLARMRHPSQAACWRFLDRRFHHSWLAHAIVQRESNCRWNAANPTSTARGVFQFLDHWGPLSSRLDAVWSINRAYRAVGDGGWSPWYPLP